jgi:hypothetical protein
MSTFIFILTEDTVLDTTTTNTAAIDLNSNESDLDTTATSGWLYH